MKKIFAIIALATVATAASAQTNAPASNTNAVAQQNVQRDRICHLNDKDCKFLIDDQNFNDGIYRGAGQ